MPSCCSTPPPTFDEVLEQRAAAGVTGSAHDGMCPTPPPSRARVATHTSHVTVRNYREDAVRYDMLLHYVGVVSA